MIILLIISTLIFLFDMYLDLRQRKKYMIKKLPASFEEGFKLSDEVDKKYQIGEYEPKTVEPAILGQLNKIHNSNDDS